MRRFLLTAGAGLVLWVSCGIETVSVLPSPDVDYTTSTDQVMTLTHSASRYAGTDFQGYEVYYRIYPDGTGFSQLSADISTLGTAPLSTLTGSLGYQALTQAAVSNTDGTNVSETLQVSGLADGDVLTLDFDDFLATANQSSDAHPPLLKLNGTAVKSVYRSQSQATGGAALMRFSTLRTATAAQSDTKSVVASGSAYEIDFFIVAYGMTSTVQALNSTPKAWGTIRSIIRN